MCTFLTHPLEARIKDVKARKNVQKSSKKREKFSDQVKIEPEEELFDTDTNSKQVELKKKIKNYSCNHCDASFSLKSSLQGHINREHLKIEPYNCEKCMKTFSSKFELGSHIRKQHENVKPNKCKDCEASFYSNIALQSHIKGMHSKIKPYKCEYCETSLSTMGNLRQHIIP